MLVCGLKGVKGWVAYALLEFGEVSWAEGICLGDDGDQVHARAETLHHLDIKRLEGMAGRTNEVQASVHP